MPDSAIDLQRAADTLGVHYQTAYKWVRSGALPASIVRGRYQLDPADVAQFAQARSAPEPPPVRRPRRGFPQLGGELRDQLVAGDERAARRLVQGLLDGAVDRTTIVAEVIAPALRAIGDRWHEGTLSIATEHRATAIVERLLGELHPTPRGRRRGVAVVAAVSGDLHALTTAMAAVALRDDNWHVEHLGADVPADEIVSFCTDNGCDLVVLSVTREDTRSTAQLTAQRLRDAGHVVLVGERGQTLRDLQAAARGR